MKTSLLRIKIGYLFSIIILALLFSCGNNVDQSLIKRNKALLDSLHTTFNAKELHKTFYPIGGDTIRIITFGHVYSLLFHEDVMDSMIETINKQDPDYIWILGDIVYNNTPEEWQYLMRKYEGLNGIRLHAGGNHDMNFHYERYFGKRDNQYVAESRFLENIGYRYLTLEDSLMNYMLINMNDSLERIEEYLSLMSSKLNPQKPSILFTHHCTWHKTQSRADDTKTWVKKSFTNDQIIENLEDFDYLIHGDWGEKFYQGFYPKPHSNKRFKVMGVGNLNEGDPLYITSIKITKDTLIAMPIHVPIPDMDSWKEIRKK